MMTRLRAVGTTAICIPIFCLGLSSAHAEPVKAYLSPSLKMGEHLSDVFSKTVSIKGTGFEEYVRRIGGSADYTVTGVTTKAITFDEMDRYDGHPTSAAASEVAVLRDGFTDCQKDKCVVNDSTSGVTFNPLLWGNPPQDIRKGTIWPAIIPNPWEIGPAGTEQMQVVRIDPLNDVITLTRSGSGSGPSSDDQQRDKPIRITTASGKAIDVSVVPGESHWRGYTTICKGVIVSDEIMVQRHVTLVSRDGEKFEGEQRSYTLLNLSQDTI